MLTRKDWEHFEETHGWREVIATVKERMQLINQDLLDPSRCIDMNSLIRLQQEYHTCLWFINLPKIDTIAEGREEGEEDETKTDRAVAPDLSPFRR